MHGFSRFSSRLALRQVGVARRVLAWGVVAAAAAQGNAQAEPSPERVVNFSAAATEELVQDQVSVTLQVIKEGSVSSDVQTALKSVLDGALQEARPNVLPNGGLDLRTGVFSVSPRYGNNGKIVGWQGLAQLVVEGTDIARVHQLVGRLSQLNVVQVSYGLSRGLREARESALTTQAIARFRARAQSMAKDFGFKGYTLGNVSVSSTEPGFEGRPPVLYAMRAKAMEVADAPLPSEPGKGVLSVTVSGHVILQP